MKRTLITALGISFLMALSVPSAKALTYVLDVGNTGISSYPAPYGTVSVSLFSPTDAIITFTAGSGGSSYNYLFGDGGSVGLSVNGTATLGGISAYTQPQTQGGAPQSPDFTVTSGNEDGMGSFNFVLDNVDGYAHAVSSITFHLFLSSGTWSSASDVLVANSNGNYAEAHIFVTNDDASWSNIGATGFAGSTTTTSDEPQVPDGGATVALVGMAILGLNFVRRQIRSS